jgi:regulator of sigma E protease
MTWLLSYLIPFGILLGILVTVHELGHFLVAKYFKIKVEKFSIGFGPKILSKKIGDTEYRLAWIPLGGYVKMAGDDPTDESARALPGSFLGAANWKRMLVVLAGPGVNLILPIFVLAGIFFVGKDHPAPWVGAVITNSPAHKAGLQPGDQVLRVDGEPIRKWDDMTTRIRRDAQPKKLQVNRDGKTVELVMTPELKPMMDEFGIKKATPTIGVTQVGETAVVAPLRGKPAHEAGIQLGDRITAIGGKPVTFWIDLDDAIASLPPGPAEVKLERPKKPTRDPSAEARTPEPVTLTLVVPENPSLETLGLESGELYVEDVKPDTPAAVAKLEVGDRLISVDGLVLAGQPDLITVIQELEEKEGDPAASTWVVEREGQEVALTLQPVVKMERVPGTSRSERTLLIGVDLHGIGARGPTYLERYRNPFVALWAGTKGTGEVISMNLRAFGKIFAGEIKPRDSVGGPIRIAQVAGMAAKAGPHAFLEVLVHMSVILGIMNLLPIPVLDGGHLAFFGMEAILRRPPSLRVREVAQQAGLLLLLAIMAFVLVNDVVTTIW